MGRKSAAAVKTPPPRALIYAPIKVPSIPMNVRIPQKLAYKLHDVCKAKGMMKQEFITAAILEALAKGPK